MSDDKSAATGPDLTLGVATDTIADGKMLLGHVGEDPVLLARRGSTFFAIGATCTHYGGPLARRADGRGHRALPVAPRLLQSEDGGSAACAGAESGRVLVDRARRRQGFRARQSGTGTGRPSCTGFRVDAEDRDHRRRRRRFRRRGDAASSALPGQRRHVERRRCGAGGQAEPLQGLPGRERAGGVDPTARRRLLRRTGHRPAA